jgi:hypothetical protein
VIAGEFTPTGYPAGRPVTAAQGEVPVQGEVPQDWQKFLRIYYVPAGRFPDLLYKLYEKNPPGLPTGIVIVPRCAA